MFLEGDLSIFFWDGSNSFWRYLSYNLLPRDNAIIFKDRANFTHFVPEEFETCSKNMEIAVNKIKTLHAQTECCD